MYNKMIIRHPYGVLYYCPKQQQTDVILKVPYHFSDFVSSFGKRLSRMLFPYCREFFLFHLQTLIAFEFCFSLLLKPWTSNHTKRRKREEKEGNEEKEDREEEGRRGEETWQEEEEEDRRKKRGRWVQGALAPGYTALDQPFSHSHHIKVRKCSGDRGAAQWHCRFCHMIVASAPSLRLYALCPFSPLLLSSRSSCTA